MKTISLEQARATVLRRSPGSPRVPPEVRRRVRDTFGPITPEKAVERILSQVRRQGDEALFRLEKVLDGAELPSLEVSQEERARSHSQVDKTLVEALELAAKRIDDFHRASRASLAQSLNLGEIGFTVRPLERVGLYVPGGTASYPSTLLMSAIPARVAGVSQVVVTTPPKPDGTVSPSTLMAADIAGVDRIFKLGGAQAIAALAYGTASVPRVDKVCGPGNYFVQCAKRKVYGKVDIDGIFGPTETLIVADGSANPALCAADLLAQAEHDAMASAILITPSPELAQAVAGEIDRQLASLSRADIIKKALEGRGGIVLAPSLEAALEAANEYAPEHLCLLVEDAPSYLPQVRHAGGVFLGESSAEALGDYVAGPSHIMPTGGSARFGSPLGVADFLKIISVFSLSRESAASLAGAASTLARAEGLTAHAKAAEMRRVARP